MKKFLKFVTSTLILATLGAGGYYLYLQTCGVTHGEILNAVREEGSLTRAHLDLRADRTDAKLGSQDEQLDRIEAKLDRILKLADAPRPDGL